MVPKILAERIKKRLSAKAGKVKERSLQDDGPVGEGTEGRHKVCPYKEKEDDGRRLTTILEIDSHRPDRIIFEGKEVKVTTIGFSLICLLAQHRGRVVGYEEILKELWEDETDAIYTRINYHICKIKKDILKVLNNKSRYAKKIGNIFKIVPGRGLMLDIKEKELETNF